MQKLLNEWREFLKETAEYERPPKEPELHYSCKEPSEASPYPRVGDVDAENRARAHGYSCVQALGLYMTKKHGQYPKDVVAIWYANDWYRKVSGAKRSQLNVVEKCDPNAFSDENYCLSS